MAESDHDKIIRMEERCLLTRETITSSLAEIKTELKSHRDYLEDGISKKIAQQIRNGVASDKTRFGIKPEIRDKIILWAMRIAVFGMAGKEGAQFLLK